MLLVGTNGSIRDFQPPQPIPPDSPWVSCIPGAGDPKQGRDPLTAMGPRNQHRDHPRARCPRRPDLRIARPQGGDDDPRRDGGVRIRPNRPGPNRTERRLGIAHLPPAQSASGRPDSQDGVPRKSVSEVDLHRPGPHGRGVITTASLVRQELIGRGGLDPGDSLVCSRLPGVST